MSDGRPPSLDADVLVVGGGPSGSATAALLAEAGWSVTVLERAVLPRPKPCGECLNPGAVAALGAGAAVLAEGVSGDEMDSEGVVSS